MCAKCTHVHRCTHANTPVQCAQGWWERPEERTLQAYMPEALEPWQVVRLEQACTLGRRKIEVCVAHLRGSQHWV